MCDQGFGRPGGGDVAMSIGELLRAWLRRFAGSGEPSERDYLIRRSSDSSRVAVPAAR
jgi:hypothetical protein